MPSSSLHILHIDDDDCYLALLGRVIRHQRPDWELSSQLADRRWTRRWDDLIGDSLTDFDAILLDYELEGCTAEPLIETMQAHFDGVPPIIVLSGTLTEERRQACQAVGAYALVDKPFDPVAVQHILQLFEDISTGAPPSWPPPVERDDTRQQSQ